MSYSLYQRQIVIEHYLKHKDDKDYISHAKGLKGRFSSFSLSKMSAHSPDKLGFQISTDCISKILVEAKVRERDLAMSRHFKPDKDKEYPEHQKDWRLWWFWLCSR